MSACLDSDDGHSHLIARPEEGDLHKEKEKHRDAQVVRPRAICLPHGFLLTLLLCAAVIFLLFTLFLYVRPARRRVHGPERGLDLDPEAERRRVRDEEQALDRVREPHERRAAEPEEEAQQARVRAPSRAEHERERGGAHWHRDADQFTGGADGRGRGDARKSAQPVNRKPGATPRLARRSWTVDHTKMRFHPMQFICR